MNNKAKSLKELVGWNSAHAAEALTEGTFIRRKARILPKIKRHDLPKPSAARVGSLGFRDSAEAREKPLAHSKAIAANFDETVERYEIDVIIAPGDCMLSTYSAAGGKRLLSPNTSFLAFQVIYALVL